MKRIIKLIEIKSTAEVNKLLAKPRYRLYERLVNGDRITYIVAEIKNLSTSEGEQAC
jgi:indole-3-glycerol phosphate synthase